MQAVIDELKSASNSASPLRLGEDMIAKTVCPSRRQSSRPVAPSRAGKTHPGFTRVRPPVLLPPRSPNHDQNLPRLTREKVWSRGVARLFFRSLCAKSLLWYHPTSWRLSG
jgi:hypothetical protein